MQYTYNAVGTLEKVTQAVSGLSSGNTMSAEYTYSGDRITSMSHSGSVYTFEYNTFGNVTNIKVAGSADSENKQSIVSYGYDSKQRKNKITYGNGTVISYSYNDDGNISEISYSTGQKYTYTYNEDKALTASYDYSSMLASIYEDGRVSAMRLFTVENSQPVLGETVYSYSVNDDGEETVTTFGRAYTKHNSTEEYISSTDSVKTKSSLSWNGWEVLNTESESDFFGRTTGKHYTVNLGEDDHPNFGTEYTYADTETTATNKISRVKNMLNGAVKSDYGYTYDNRGNILTVSKSGVLFQQYVYDEASQVKAEYNYAEHTAMTYVYDANGNIVSKTPYTNVTSSDLSTATQGTAIVYGYGDGNWSDKLTAYDGQTISYDASGNPTSYRGETVTWNGRLMTSFTKDDRRYEYSYNSDGMRTVKRVYEGDELVYTYTYIWDGDVLLAGRMEVTDADEPITIRYLYDDSGELYGMDYNGNGYFAFIKNLQGDIVSIVPLDSESNVELNIEYDAWGKPIFEESSLGAAFVKAMIMAATNVGYRGYFYDFETGLYYLRSRYYDPEIGRFINADDTNYLGYDDTPLSMNLFSYCENNPVNCIDLWGTYNYGAVNGKIGNYIPEMRRKFEGMRKITLFSSYKPNGSTIHPSATYRNYYVYKGYGQVIDGKRTTIFLNYHPVSSSPFRKRAKIYVMSKEAWLLWYTKQNSNIITKFDGAIRRALGISQSNWDMTLDALQEQTIYSKVAIGASLYSFIVSVADQISKRKPKYKFVYDICKKYKNKNQKIYILWSLETLDYRIISSRGAKKYYGWVVSGSQNLF